MLRPRQFFGGIARQQVTLVQREQARLRDVERKMLGGWNGGHGVRPIKRVVGQTVILASEHDGHAAMLGVRQQVHGSGPGRVPIPFGGPATSGKGDHVAAIGERLVDGVEVLNALDHIPGVVRDLLEPILVVRARSNEAQIHRSHVFHRADDGPDVDGILRLIQDHRHGGHYRFGHPTEFEDCRRPDVDERERSSGRPPAGEDSRLPGRELEAEGPRGIMPVTAEITKAGREWRIGGAS